MTSGPIPSVVLPRFLLDGHGAELDAATRARAEFISGDDPVLSERIPDTLEVIVTGIDSGLFERLVATPSVRWVHSLSAGVEHLPLDAMAERGIVLTNSAGVYAPAMAEYALAAMIALGRAFPTWLEGQRDARWIDADGMELTLLRGKRLGIVGYGAVGRELAALAKGMGMEVWATKRTPLVVPTEPIDRLLPATGLHELLAASDVVALCASLNRTTRHLIGGGELAVMKPTAVLVNVARGGLVDEEALVRALREGALRGAALDVTDVEPLPPDSALWTTPNLLLTPHISGNSVESWRWAVGFFCQNLALYLDGTPERMGNLVDYPAVR